jgi:histidinol-phosphate aminotransferase
MFNLEKLVRKNILALQPYSSARDEYKGKDAIFLDANENPFGEFNRYPDPKQVELKKQLSEIKNIASENIFVGNGSDEVIDLAYRIFCEPGKDKALTFTPTYGMYDVSAGINDVALIKVPLTNDFQIDFDTLENYLKDENVKLIFICSPNNPTGNNIDNIEKIIENFEGIVFIDEAYIDFSNAESFIKKIAQFPNIIISQTFSKAWGLAAARVGTAYASKAIIDLYNKVKPPYNVSKLNQDEALKILLAVDNFEKNKNIILEERKKLIKNFSALPIVKKIYPSDANFILVEVDDANKMYEMLVEAKVITRNRNSVVKNCLRITVGSEVENERLLEVIKAHSISAKEAPSISPEGGGNLEDKVED